MNVESIRTGYILCDMAIKQLGIQFIDEKENFASILNFIEQLKIQENIILEEAKKEKKKQEREAKKSSKKEEEVNEE